MALPKIDLPVYNTTISSRSAPVQFTPFTVKEGTILMMAKESGELQTMVDALKQILSNCLVDKSIDINKIPMIDMEWLFVQIQSKSSGENIPLHFKCKNPVIVASQTIDCGMIIECAVDLRNIHLPVITEESCKIQLNDKVELVMRLPTFEATQRALTVKQTLQDHMLAAMCIDYVYDESTITKADDAEPEELFDFVQHIEQSIFEEKILKFIDNIPSLTYTICPVCPKCNYKHEIKLEGLADFFA